MTYRTRSVLLAGSFASLFALAAAAQQAPAPGPAVTTPPSAAPAASPAPAPTPPALPPGSPLIGRPDSADAAKLAPVAGPPIATAADKLPIGKFKLPPGFNIEVYASGMADAREIRVSDKGTLFVGNRVLDKVYAVTPDKQVKVIAKGLHRPNGVAIHDGTLYIAELSQIEKIDNIESQLDNPPKPTVIYSDLPKDEAHGWKFISIGPDNKLYVPVGQPGNNEPRDPAHAQIRRMNLDGSGAEVIAIGVRNTVGFDWNPENKQLYFTDNGRDWMSEDVPEDKLNRLTKVGEDFGVPYCYQGNIPDPQFGWGHSCSDYTPPVGLMGPHTATLGMRFYSGSMFPKDYKNVIFVARHGSWNRTKKQGGDVVAVTLKKDGTVASVKPFLTGFIQDNNYVGRPVDVQPMKDGSLLVSDDWNGAVYRITYGKKTAGK